MGPGWDMSRGKEGRSYETRGPIHEMREGSHEKWIFKWQEQTLHEKRKSWEERWVMRQEREESWKKKENHEEEWGRNQDGRGKVLEMRESTVMTGKKKVMKQDSEQSCSKRKRTIGWERNGQREVMGKWVIGLERGTNNLVVPSSQLIKSTQPTLPISTIKQDIHWYESHYLRSQRKPQVPKFMALHGESPPKCLLITKLPCKFLSLFVNLT